MKRIKIAKIAEIERYSSFGFELEQGEECLNGFIAYQDGQYFAYKNQCPHTGAPLDWVEHQFLDLDKALIQCAVHDARFEIETGECIFGPCAGDQLEKLKIEISGDEIFLILQ